MMIAFPQDVSTNVLMLLRWLHIAAAIVWVGLLYFFNLVNVKFLPTLDGPTRSRIYPPLMSRALFWFRWGSVVTVLAGIGYWMHVASMDAKNWQALHGTPASPGQAFWTFFVFWTLAFAVEMGVLMAVPAMRKVEIIVPIAFVAAIIASWGYLAINSQGWESNRVLCIGIGGGIGWFMMFNVWGIIWRVQKKLIRFHSDTPGAAMPDDLTQLAKTAAIASRVNFYLSFPLLFFMAAASHYPFLG